MRNSAGCSHFLFLNYKAFIAHTHTHTHTHTKKKQPEIFSVENSMIMIPISGKLTAPFTY